MTKDLLESRPELKATLMTVDGSRTRDEVAEGIGRLIQLFQADPTRNVIIDIRDAVYDQPINDIIKDWSLVASLLPRARIALVHSARTAQPALATVGALEASHHAAEVFETLEDAFTWIGQGQSS